MHEEGDRLIIEPVKQPGLLALLAGWDDIDEVFPDLDQGLLPLRDVTL